MSPCVGRSLSSAASSLRTNSTITANFASASAHSRSEFATNAPTNRARRWLIRARKRQLQIACVDMHSHRLSYPVQAAGSSSSLQREEHAQNRSKRRRLPSSHRDPSTSHGVGSSATSTSMEPIDY